MPSPVTIVIGLLVILPCCITQSLYKPPNIHDPSISKLEYISDGVDVRLNCTAEGTAPIKFKWRKDTEEIINNNYFTVNETTGHLTITSFTLREEGQYQCVAQNSVTRSISPVAVSPIITLRKERLATSWPDTPKKSVTGTEGGYARLNCTNVPESVPKPRFSWFIESGGEKNQIKPDERIYIDNTGTLHFLSLETDDQQASANSEYKCAIYNTKDAFILGSPKSLVVIPIPATESKPQTKPQYAYATNNITFLNGRTAELECVFSGNPVPTINWYTPSGKPIVDSDKYEINDQPEGSYYRKLLVKNVHVLDEGKYKCTGTNNVGSTDAAAELKVTSGPIWEKGLTSQTIPEERSVSFTCKAKASEDESLLLQPIWYKNGKLMDSLPGENMEFSERRTVLTLRAIRKPDDIMCFQCNVSNSNGVGYDSACLNVIEPIVVEQAPPQFQEIERGDPIDLTVIAKTDPGLTLKDLWYFRNITYDGTLPPHVVKNDVTKKYYINTTSFTDEEFRAIQGVYIREFYHLYERRNVSTDVFVKGPTPAPIVQAAFPWWVIVVVIVIILLILLLILIILCCCRNKEQGAYKIYKTELNTAYLDPDKDIEKNKFQDVARIDGDEDQDAKTPLKLGPGYDESDEADSLDQYQGGRPESTA